MKDEGNIHEMIRPSKSVVKGYEMFVERLVKVMFVLNATEEKNQQREPFRSAMYIT